MDKGIKVLRELARKYIEISSKDIQKERRDLWRKHNSLSGEKTMIRVMPFAAWQEILPDSHLQCESVFFRGIEKYFQQMLFQDSLGEDSIIEPWVTVKATHTGPRGNSRWGAEINFVDSTVEGGAGKHDAVLKEPEDIRKLVKPYHKIDMAATMQNVAILEDAIGDIIQVNVDRGPEFTSYRGDISTDLAALRGLEQVMWDMYDRPEWLHELVGFMRDGILEVQNKAEAEGDFSLSNHENQSMPYSLELEDPKANSAGVKRSQLWTYMASQEFALISPEMFDEFLLQYQIPILEKYGLVSYGCCEDLSRKIKFLRKIKNLRRIAVTPWADTRACAEQIGKDYVVSWRPNPAEMVCIDFDPQRIRQIVQNAMKDFKQYECHVDITLKDVKTIKGKPEVLKKWVEIVRDVVES